MPNEHDDFRSRVKGLREKRGWSQVDLAREAGLAPALLSRLLSGERNPRMDHVSAIARALGVTVIELTEGTAVADVVKEWVPRAEFERADLARADAERDLEVSRAEASALRAEAASLRESVGTLSRRSAEVERELAKCSAEASRAKHLAAQNGELSGQVHALRSQVASLQAEAAHHREAAEQAGQLANRNFSAWQLARSRIAALEADLAKAKNDKMAVGVFSAALGGLAAAMLASPAETTRTRRRG